MNIQELTPQELNIWIAKKLRYYCKITTEDFEGSFGRTYSMTEPRIFSPKGDLIVKHHHYRTFDSEQAAWENSFIPDYSGYFPRAYELAQQVLGHLYLEFIKQADGTVWVADGFRTVLSSLTKMKQREAYSHPSITDPVEKLSDALARLCAKVMENEQ